MSADEAVLQTEHTSERHQHGGHESPQTGGDYVEAVAAASQDGMKLFAERALEGAARQVTARLNAVDHRLCGAAPTQVMSERKGHLAGINCAVDRLGRNSVAALAAPSSGACWPRTQPLPRLAQQARVMRVPGHRLHIDDKALLVGHLYSFLVTKSQ